MGSSDKINSESYWDARFREDWESCDGPWQTRFFYQVAVNSLPAWLLWQIKSQPLTLVDWGCAQGDGADVWASHMSPERVAAVDFSAVAIEQAAKRYPSIRFIHEDWLDDAQDIKDTFDIVFSSNTLEHFHSPFAVLQKLVRRAKTAVILTLPYREMERIDEHFYTFLPENIPVRLPNGFKLYWAKVVDCRNLPKTQWGGDQVILLYASEEWIDGLGLTLSDCQIEHEDHASKVARIRRKLDTCEHDLAGKSLTLDGLAKRVSELSQTVVERGVQIADLTHTFAESAHAVASMERAAEKHLEARDGLAKRVSELSQTVASMDRAAKKHLEEISALKQALVEGQAKRDELGHSLSQKESDAVSANAQFAEANRQLLLLLSSRSWRLASALSRLAHALVPWRRVGAVNEVIEQDEAHASIWRRRLRYMVNRYIEGVRRYGVVGSIRPAFRAATSLSSMWVRKKVRSKLYEKRLGELRNIIACHKGFVDIFHVPMGWKTPLFQRFQHMSLQASQMGGLALYGGHLQVDVDLFVYERSQDGVVVFDALDQRVVDLVFSALRQCNGKKILRLQSIDLATRKEEIERFLGDGFVVVYEYIDEISEEITGEIPAFVLERHKWLLGEPRILVVATSDKIYEQVRKQRQVNCLLSTNGVDLQHWQGITSRAPPDDMLSVIQAGRIIVGYHGALANWIDYDLLRKIAEDGRFELVLIGYAHDASLVESGLLASPHVHFLGSKSYFKLNKYAICYDIGILPFKKYALTESVSPVKLFEYMAAGKPVVTTDLRECNKYESCLVASSHEQFMENLEAAISLRFDTNYLDMLRRDAEQNSWRGKALAIFDQIGLKGALN